MLLTTVALAAAAFAPSPVARPQVARATVRAQMSFFDAFQQPGNQEHALNMYWASTFTGLAVTGILAACDAGFKPARPRSLTLS